MVGLTGYPHRPLRAHILTALPNYHHPLAALILFDLISIFLQYVMFVAIECISMLMACVATTGENEQ